MTMFSTHARERMEERGVTSFQVLDTLQRNYAAVWPSRREPNFCFLVRSRAHRSSNGAPLIVVTDKLGTIRSVWWEGEPDADYA